MKIVIFTAITVVVYYIGVIINVINSLTEQYSKRKLTRCCHCTCSSSKMYDSEDSDSDFDGFEVSSGVDYSHLATKCEPPDIVSQKYNTPKEKLTGYQNQDFDSLRHAQENNVNTNVNAVPINKYFGGRGRAKKRDEMHTNKVPVQVKQNFQRQNLSTSLEFSNSKYRPIGRGMPRNSNNSSDRKGENVCDTATQAGVSSNYASHDAYDEELGTSVDPVPVCEESQEPVTYLPSNIDDADGAPVWETEEDAAECVFKPKENPVFQPKVVRQSESLSFDEIRKTNPDVSPRWLASTLAKKQLQPRADEMRRVLKTVDHMWFDDSANDKDKKHVSQYLAKVYTDSINPFVLVGYLIDQVRDSHTAKTTTLSFFMMKEFDKWYKTNKRKVYPKKYLSMDLQMHVFDICTRNHLTMLDMAVRCFHLCYHGNDQFLPTVKNFLSKKKYKEVDV